MAAWAADATRYGARAWLRALMNSAQLAIPGFGDAYDPREEDEAAARWARTLPDAELFYVASNLSTLVHHAAQSLSDYRLHPDDLPAREVFARAIHVLTVENETLRKELRKVGETTIVPMRQR